MNLTEAIKYLRRGDSTVIAKKHKYSKNYVTRVKKLKSRNQIIEDAIIEMGQKRKAEAQKLNKEI
ncbi:MAG: hypothetical protein ACRCR9_00065 [Chitinophagaceae bacterium]